MNRCAYCIQGLVVARTRPQGNDCVDEMGPCPYCTLGNEQNQKHFYGEFWTRPENSKTMLQPIDWGEKPLPLEENKRRLAELMVRLNGATA